MVVLSRQRLQVQYERLTFRKRRAPFGGFDPLLERRLPLPQDHCHFVAFEDALQGRLTSSDTIPIPTLPVITSSGRG